MNFAHSLIAVLAGNIVYFLLMPHLPVAARHLHKYDFGVLVDFVICLAIFLVIRTISQRKDDSRQPHQ
jgi:hypothetical protein